MKKIMFAIAVTLTLTSAAQAKTNCGLNSVAEEFMYYTSGKVEEVTYVRKLRTGRTLDLIGAARMHTLKNHTTRKVDLFKIKATDTSLHQIYAAVGVDSETCRLLEIYNLEIQNFNFGTAIYYPEEND